MNSTDVAISSPQKTAEEIRQEFEQYISALARVCKTETYHGEYGGRTTFAERAHSSDTEDCATHMSIHIDSTYLWYRVTVYPIVFEYYKGGNLKEIAGDMMHEHCHLFIDPIEKLFMWDASASQREHYMNTIERQTQRICNTILDLMPDGWYLPEKIMGGKAA